MPFDRFGKHAFYQAPDGRIFIGSIPATGEGFFYFHPEEIKDNMTAPPVVVTDFKVRNETVALDSGLTTKKHIELKHYQNFFSFEFTALDYHDPERCNYAYYLDGLEDDWIYSGGRRYVSYSSVPPGEYVFRVRGSNSNGYWNEKGTAIAVTILPPFWKTWWAYLCYALLLAGLIILWRYYDLRRISLKQQLEIEHLEATKLKELDIMKSRFFANISHEFRTPLTLVIGPLEKIRSQVSGEFSRDLDIMKRNAQRLQHLINQLLMLSKLESGQMKLKTREENIVKLVNDCLQSFESLAKKRKIALHFYFDEPEILLYVDRDKMEKILLNLLSNALKYTPAGGRVAVTVGQLDSWTVGQKVRIDHEKLSNCQLPTANLMDNCTFISISDTGSGIAPAHLPHIFDRFYQANDTDSSLQEGTGIGLALTKELVELHYGKISVSSEVGVGTTFAISLIRGKSHLKEDEILDQADLNNDQDIYLDYFSDDEKEDIYLKETVKKGKNDQGREVDKRSKPAILLVEDNADLREYIRGFLQLDYQLLESSNGSEGWQVAAEKIPDLVISDVMMPGMDGFELCQKLKNDERTSHIPVILLTALAGQENKLDGLKTGADDFITKPFDPAELLVRVGNLLEQRRKLKENLMRKIARMGLISEIMYNDGELQSADEQFMQKVIKVIVENMSDPQFNVGKFAAKMAMSHMQLHRKLVAVTGQSANRLVKTFRLAKAAQLLKNRSGNVTEIAFEVGFNNLSWFAKCFHDEFGVSPSEYASNSDIV